jgi:hypothetical protein
VIKAASNVAGAEAVERISDYVAERGAETPKVRPRPHKTRTIRPPRKPRRIGWVGLSQ